MLKNRMINMLHPKYALTCSLQLPNQDFIVGDNHGNLVRHRRVHANAIIHKYSDSAVSALALLSKCKQYVSAHTDGYLRLRNFEDKLQREIKIGYTADFLVELSNGLLLAKGKHGTFDVYDLQKRERILREHVDKKFLARIPNSDMFVFQDLVSSLLIMQMTEKGFIWKKSILLLQHNDTEIQALHMLSQTVGVAIKSDGAVLCKLNENPSVQLKPLHLEIPFVNLHLLSSSAEGLSAQVHAFCVTSKDTREINLAQLFPDLLKHIDLTNSKQAAAAQLRSKM